MIGAEDGAPWDQRARGIWGLAQSLLLKLTCSEPTDKDMRIIFPSEAKKLWGSSASRVSGTSFVCNDPPQFLDHYYHFAAEFFFGMWRTYSSLDPGINAAGETSLPAPSRLIFPHTAAGRWNDYAKMNSFILRAVFPALSYEYDGDFADRKDTARAYIYDRVVFADRAAAFRGPEFGKTWRTSSEAVTLGGSRYWWSPIRRNLIEFVGGKSGSALNLQEFGVDLDQEYLDNDALQEMGIEIESPSTKTPDRRSIDAAVERRAIGASDEAPQKESRKYAPSNPVITYVSRQDWGRRMLKPEDHDTLVKELGELEKKYGWEVNIVAMDKLSRDEQIRLAARTTIMMGVHGNGLTHLLWMNNLNPRATVMEFFIPGGFAEDYEYTARALGIRHYGWWGDHSFTYPNIPPVEYPDGFQGNSIPLDGKAVAQLCEQRLVVDRVADKAKDKRTGEGSA